MKLNELRDNPGARKTRLRVGRGEGSGMGKTSRRGQKGLGARSGGRVPLGFEGGQNPLYRRLPIRGFNNHNFRTEYAIMNLDQLQQFADAGRIDASKPVTLESLVEARIIRDAKDGLKILGNGNVSAKFEIEAIAASKSAVEKVAKAGGSIKLLGATA